MGKKKQPIYKMVAADSRSPRDGKFLEAVGFYNPLTDPHTLDLKEDRIMYWLNVGAQPTHTVKSLLRQKGIILKKELISKGLDEEKVKSELENWQNVKEASSKKKKTDKKLSRKAKAKQEAQASADAAPKEETAEEPKPETEQEVKAPVESEAKEAAPEEPKAEVKEEKQDAAEKDAPAEEPKSEDKKE